MCEMMGLRPAPCRCSMAIIFAREPKVWLKRSKSVTNSKVWMKEEMSVYLYALGYLRLADARGFCVCEKETAYFYGAMSRTQEREST